MKVHKQRIVTYMGIKWVFTLCGLAPEFVTSHKSRVTCKRCLKIMRKETP